ncbi:hypothetical protein HFD88_010688 [Aspergillus terreus]|nr:hypothetical protein HFD88_010688 [Aspergillus terreus]
MGSIGSELPQVQGLSTLPPFTLKDATVENFRRVRVVVIGAGFSGIYAGIRCSEWLRNVDLTIYDKNDGIGGTWWENRYPGCACDIPAHSYVYSFEPNPAWSSFYVSSSEIQGYLQMVHDKYSVGRFVKLQHKVVGCKWEPEQCKWHVEVENLETNDRFIDVADVVINAPGGLNNYRWPDIAGLRSFHGKLVHSAAWDTAFDYSHKRIGVIGNGSSAIQIVPELQKLPETQLTCFMRSKTWIAEPFGESALKKLGIDHNKFTDEDRQKFMSDENKFHTFRKTIESELNGYHPVSLKGSDLSEGAHEAFAALMTSRLAKKPELAELLIPKFAPGCRRLTPGPGYLEALTEPNVAVSFGEIEAVVPEGIIMKDGTKFELDVLVCATGFHTNLGPPFPIIGLGEKTLQQRYEKYPEAYLSVATDGFPNFFHMLGPNSGVGSGSLTTIIERSGEYIVKCIRKMQKEDIAAMHISPRSVKDWLEYVHTYFQKTVFLDDCKSWYRKGDRIIHLWPGSTLHAIETFRSPRWEDYEYIYRRDSPTERNRLAWLGNGWSEQQLNNGDMAYYVEPAYVDFPAAPRPEETKKWTVASWSH